MVVDASYVESVRVPCVFVQGERDEIGPPDRLRAVVERMPAPPTLVVIPGADHFFTGRLEELEGSIASWAAARPWTAPGA